jgi:hypothetical protein
MIFSLRRKRPTTLRRGRPTPTAATISLCAWLLLAGGASAQSIVTAPDWRPSEQAKPQPIPASFQNVEAVQFKPAQPPQPFPADKVLQPVPQPAGRIIPVGMKIRPTEDEGGLTIRTEIPGLDQLTQRLAEEDVFEKWRKEYQGRPGTQRMYFPLEERVSNEVFTGRQSPYMVRFVEPNYVVHGHLYFEQKNFDRYGWDIGPLSPGIEAGLYFYDLVMLPYHIGANACHSLETSAGKCLPGDATPLMVYREQFSITGLVFQAGAVFGGAVLFP